jgi:hypothetical protein
MRSIYEGAKFVFMWLGEADEDSDTAMRFLVDFNDDLDAEKPSQLEKMLNGIATSREALRNLFVREYWKRVWIMQEVIVSKNAYVCCGKFIAKWTSVALFLLAMPEHRLHQETLYDFMSVRRAADAYVIPLAKLFLKRFAQVEISPYEGLQLSRQRYATELHDYVFAVLGFTKPFPITVDYGIPVPELVVDLVEKFIERDRNLDILTLCKDFDPEQYDNDQGAIETEARRMLREFKESLKRPNHSCRTMLVFTANQFIRHYEKELTIATGQSRYQDQRREQRYQKRQQENSGKEKAKDRLEEELEHRQRGEEVENDEELDAREAKSFWSEVGLFALPSWVPRWHDRAVSEEKYISFKRFRLGTLRASKDVSASVEFRRSDLGLSIKGILIDAVTYSIEPSHMMASLSDEEKETILPWSDNVVEMGYKSFVDEWKTWSDAYAEQKSSQYGDLEGQRNAYRELVFLDPEWEQGDQQNLISRVINAALKWTDESMMDIQTGGPYLKSLPQLPSYFHHFVTKSGYMGRGPKTTNKGDLVCILYGASVPFVLREFEEKYYLLGECCKSHQRSKAELT